jgi:hypothetical protein
MAEEKDPFKDMKDQFADMRESLEKIASQTKPVEEVAKANIKHEHRPTPRAPKDPKPPKVELGKETKKEILAALRNIRSRIVESQQRENTMADVAAEHLAGGGSVKGAIGAAAGFKTRKIKTSIKKRFDPLNIVHRLTGGSKLATVLAGRIMGRSEQSIRSAAGLQGVLPPGLDGAAGAAGSPSPANEGTEGGASPVSSTKVLNLLEKMVLSLHNIEKFEEQGVGLAKAEAERIRDKEAAESAKFKKVTPKQIIKGEEKKEGPSWLETLMGWFKILGAAALEFAASLGKLLNPLSLLGGALTRLLPSITGALKSLGKGAIGAVTKGGSAILKGGKAIIGGVKDLAGKILGTGAKVVGEAGEKAAGKIAAKELSSASKITKGVGVAVEGVAKIAPKSKIAGVLGRIAPKILGSKAATLIPVVGSAVGLAFAASRLLQGDLVGAGIDAAGALPIPGAAIPSLVASLVRDAYMEIYNADPFTDPLIAERLPSLMTMAKESVSDWLMGEAKTKSESPTAVGDDAARLDAIVGQTGSSVTPASMGGENSYENSSVPQTLMSSSPTELPAATPQTGQTLTQANDLQRNAAMTPATQGIVAPTIINNVKNQTTNSTTTHQNMPPARSGESSYLRSLDRGFAPA